MKQFTGYLKRKLGDSYALLAGGGTKSLSDFLGSILYNSENKKILYKASNASNWSDLVSFGDRAFDSTTYLPLSGGTLTNSEFYTLLLTGGTQGKGINLSYTDPSDNTKSYNGLILFRLSDWGMAIANYNATKAIGISSDGTPYYGWLNSKNTLLHSGNFTTHLDSTYVNITGDSMSGTLTITKYGPTINNYVADSWAFQSFEAYNSSNTSSRNLYHIGTYYTRDTFEIRRNGGDNWAFSPTVFYGYANNTYYLGSTTYRWANIYSTLGNFSSTLTSGDIVTGTAYFGNEHSTTAYKNVITLYHDCISSQTYNSSTAYNGEGSWGISFDRGWGNGGYNSTNAAGMYAYGTGSWGAGLVFRVYGGGSYNQGHDRTALDLLANGEVKAPYGFIGNLTGCVLGTNSAASPGGALLLSGAGRADTASGDTWIFYDSLGGTSSPWGIKHDQLNNNILFYGAGNLRTTIHLGESKITASTFSGNATTATSLSNTPNNTTTFLRGDNTWTNTINATIDIFPSGGNYADGLRLHSRDTNNGWCAITFCASDNTGTTGQTANSWYLGVQSGNFYIGKGGTGSGSEHHLRSVSQAWECSGTWHQLSHMYVDGSLGVGTTSPTYTLSVIKNSDVWHALFGTSGGNLFRIGGSTPYGATIGAYSTNANNGTKLSINRDGGNVGIGIADPSYKLDVNGEICSRSYILVNNASGRSTIYNRSYANQPNDLWFGSNNTDHWSLTSRESGNPYLGLYCTKSGVWAWTCDYSSTPYMHFNYNVYAPNFYTTSDRSKKQNISSLSEHIRKFQLKDTEKWHYGVIALEVEEMFREGEEGNMTVNYNSILSYYVGLLENKVSELSKTVKQLSEEIDKLKILLDNYLK